MGIESSGGPESQVWMLHSQEHSTTVPVTLGDNSRDNTTLGVQHIELTVFRKKIPETPPEPPSLLDLLEIYLLESSFWFTWLLFSVSVQRGFWWPCCKKPGKCSLEFYFEMMVLISNTENYEDIERMFKRFWGNVERQISVLVPKRPVLGFLW